jgi:hypothetical protein
MDQRRSRLDSTRPDRAGTTRSVGDGIPTQSVGTSCDLWIALIDWQKNQSDCSERLARQPVVAPEYRRAMAGGNALSLVDSNERLHVRLTTSLPRPGPLAGTNCDVAQLPPVPAIRDPASRPSSIKIVPPREVGWGTRKRREFKAFWSLDAIPATVSESAISVGRRDREMARQGFPK